MEQLQEIKKELIQFIHDDKDYLSLTEFSQITDMIKDLCEAVYYCSITK